MKADVLKEQIDSLVSFVGFDYLGVSCGIDPINHSHFEMWYGKAYLEAKSIDEVMTTPLFDGKSLEEIADDIVITDW